MTQLVSILIPTYNRAGLIKESIHAALAQTVEDIEVVVVDNASTDGTWDEIQEVAATNPKVRSFRNASNIGPVRNWIECVRHARGKYAKILWSDDLIAPTYLERCLPQLESDDVGFVYSSAKIFCDDLGSDQAGEYYNHLPTGSHSSQVFIEGALLGGPFPYSPGCALFRAEDVRNNLWLQIPNSVGSDFSKHAIGNDFLLFLLTAHRYKFFAVVNEPLSYFRDHAGSISTASGAGRLILHYDMARAFFAQKYVTDAGLKSKLNTMLWMHLRRFDGRQYGLVRVRNFYPDLAPASLSIRYLAYCALRKLASAFG